MSNFAGSMAGFDENENKVTSSTIRLFMTEHAGVLHTTYVPLQRLKQFEDDLARFGRDIRLEFESLWYSADDDEDFPYWFGYPAEISYTNETWLSIREKHYNHLVTRMEKGGYTNIEELTAHDERHLVELVERDVDENLARVRLEIPSLEGRLSTGTETDYERLGLSEVQIQKLRRLGEEFYNAWLSCQKVGATYQEEEDLFVAGVRFVNGDGEALTNFALRLMRLRGRPVQFWSLDAIPN